jgi:hypothetical protein
VERLENGGRELPCGAVPSLANPRAKLERAQEHLLALDAATGEFFEVDPYGIVGEFDPQTSDYVFRVKVLREPPLRLGVILGDFIHSLRSALDQLVWQLVLLDGGSPDRSTCFPVASSSAEFQYMAERALRGLVPEQVARIEALQPYHAGDRAKVHLLTLLPWLSNTDKHQVIHPTLGWFRSDFVKEPRFISNEDAAIVGDPQLARIERMEDGAVVARAKVAALGPKPEVKMDAQIQIDIAFGERPLRATALAKIADGVHQIIESFALDFEGVAVGVA